MAVIGGLIDVLKPEMVSWIVACEIKELRKFAEIIVHEGFETRNNSFSGRYNLYVPSYLWFLPLFSHLICWFIMYMFSEKYIACVKQLYRQSLLK